MATHWFPKIIKEFQKDYPNVDYELLLGDYKEIEEWIAEGRVGRSKREMTTPLFLLRCVEIGVSISDLDLLTVGLLIDMWTEKEFNTTLIDPWLNLGYNKATKKKRCRCRLSLCAI